MKKTAMNRRDFMKGLGTTAFALPFLESLNQKAFAAGEPPSRIVLLAHHQGHYFNLFFPQNVTNWTKIQDTYGAARYAPLASISGPLSKVLGTRFDSVRAKMNIIQGLDLPSISGHNQCAGTTCSGSRDSYGPANFGYSFDTIMSQSTTFNKTTPYKKVVRFVPETGYYGGGQYTWFYDTVNGAVNTFYPLGGVGDMFTEFFANNTQIGSGNTTPTDTNFNRRTALNSLVNQLNQLSQSTRLPASDKIKMQQHTSMINDLVTTLQPSSGGSGNTCTKPAQPNSNLSKAGAGAGNRYKACFDMLVSIFNCRLTNVAAAGLLDVSDAGDIGFYDPFHNNVFHSAYNETLYLNMVSFVWDQIAYLINQMNSITEENGKTMLDNSLVIVVPEFGDPRSHSLNNMPVVTFGSLNGKVKSGNFLDYSQDNGMLFVGEGNFNQSKAGRPLNNFYVTLFNALGIPSSEYERGGNAGFGDYSQIATAWNQYSSMAARRSSLPFLV